MARQDFESYAFRLGCAVGAAAVMFSMITGMSGCGKAPTPSATVSFSVVQGIQSVATLLRGLTEGGLNNVFHAPGFPVILSQNYCYFILVSATDGSIGPALASGEANPGCLLSPRRRGLVSSTARPSEVISMDVPAGPARRFDLLGVHVVNFGNCPDRIGIGLDGAGRLTPEALSPALSPALAYSDLRTFASSTADVVPGAATEIALNTFNVNGTDETPTCD